jgi:hypothetical protein
MYKGLSTIKEVIKDRDKILKILIDRAATFYAEYRSSLDQPRVCRIDVDATREALFDAANEVWEILHQAYSQGPDFKFTSPKQKRELGQANKLLDFAYRVSTALLKDTSRSFKNHRAQNQWHSKLRTAQNAQWIAERFCHLCTQPDGTPYRHPQADRWHSINSQCQERIGRLWLEAAQESLAEALAIKKSKDQ